MDQVHPTPAALRLKQVLLIHRHGERTSVHTNLRTNSAIVPEEAWKNQCKLKPFLQAMHKLSHIHQAKQKQKPQSATETSPLPITVEQSSEPSLLPPDVPNIADFVVDGKSGKMPQSISGHHLQDQWRQALEDPTNFDCGPGILTDIGKTNLINKGRQLRSLYVQKLGLLPETLENPKDIYVRSTSILRTIESAQYLLAGLLPREARKFHDFKIHFKSAENMFPSQKTCDRLSKLFTEFQAAAEIASSPLLTSLNYRVAKTIPTFIPPSSIHNNTFSPLKMTLQDVDILYDNLACSLGAGIPLPRGVTLGLVEDLQDLFSQRFWNGFAAGGLPVQRLSIGRFVGDLKTMLGWGYSGGWFERPPKLAIFSGHDTTVGPLLASFDLMTGPLIRWPPFAATITLELYHDTSKYYYFRKRDHYVRFLYNGVPMALPACSKLGSHFVGDPTLCTYQAFVKAMERVIPRSYERECKDL